MSVVTIPLPPSIDVIKTLFMTKGTREQKDGITEPHTTRARKGPRPMSSCTIPISERFRKPKKVENLRCVPSSHKAMIFDKRWMND